MRERGRARGSLVRRKRAGWAAREGRDWAGRGEERRAAAGPRKKGAGLGYWVWVALGWFQVWGFGPGGKGLGWAHMLELVFPNFKPTQT